MITTMVAPEASLYDQALARRAVLRAGRLHARRDEGAPEAVVAYEALAGMQPAQSVPAAPSGVIPGLTLVPAQRGALRCGGGCGRKIARQSRTGLCRECRTAANAPVPCLGYGKCQAMVSPKNKTGKCRACWREGLSANARKTEPEVQAAMIARMLASFAERSKDEDPGRGLAALRAIARQASAAVKDVGRYLVAEQGPSAVAADMGMSRQLVHKMWGGERA